jgi:uncharacterized protein YbjT (DUF2867 family)
MADKNTLIVITCAAGRQCAHIIPFLYPKYPLRLIVNSPTSQSRLKNEYPNADVIQADITSRTSCSEILQDATHVFHIGPSLHPSETEIGINIISAAVSESQRPNNRFKHFIYSSVLNTQFRKMFNHDRKRYVEEYLFETDLNYTVLNPGDFLNMAFPIKYLAGMDKPEYKALMGLQSKSAFVVLEDYAEAVEKVIREGERHYAAQYQMVSMAPIAYGTVAEDMGKVLKEKTGKELVIGKLGLEEGIRVGFGRLWPGAESEESSPREMDGVERLVLFYQRRGLKGNPNTVEWLLERKPTSHVEWFEKQLKD